MFYVLAGRRLAISGGVFFVLSFWGVWVVIQTGAAKVALAHYSS